jgi:hypothetical protein
MKRGQATRGCLPSANFFNSVRRLFKQRDISFPEVPLIRNTNDAHVVPVDIGRELFTFEGAYPLEDDIVRGVHQFTPTVENTQFD